MDREREGIRDRRGLRRHRSSRYAAAALSLAMVVAGCASSGGGDDASGAGDPGPDVTDTSRPGEPGSEDAADADVLDPAEDVSETGPGVVAGNGTASITISGTEYAFTADYCISTASSFEILGSGETDAGSFYAEITLDDASADLDDDGAADRTGDVSLTIGDDEAIYKSTVLVMGMGATEEFTYAIADGAVTGSGQITDLMAGGNDDLEFSAECT